MATQPNTDTTGYRALSFPEKVKYWTGGAGGHGGGTVYRDRKGYRMEWRSAPGKSNTNSIAVRSTQHEARALLDMIMVVPYRSRDDALNIIAPYVELVRVSGGLTRVARGPVPSYRPSARAQRREEIERSYWRMKLLDTLEAYRSFDDD
jgi:hypothetical protein